MVGTGVGSIELPNMAWPFKYGYAKEAKELAEKTVLLFGNDLQENGALHEYYEPETGRPILNPGFQNWNYLVINMLAWLEGKSVVEEF